MPALNRSPLLQALLEKQATPPQRISSYGQLAAELGAQLLRQKQIKGIEGKQQADTKAILDALGGGGVIDESGAMGKQSGDPQRALMLALQSPDVLQSNPMLAQMLMSQMQPEEAYTLAPGAVRMQGSKALAANPGQAPDEHDIIQKLRAAGFDPSTPEAQEFARQMLLKPGVQIDMGEKFGPVPGGMKRTKDPNSPTGSRLVNEPGAPKDKLPAETAAKIGMLSAAEKSLTEAEAIILPKDGSYRRGVLTALNSPIRTGAAATVYNAMRDAMGNRLRAESGGAIGQQEIDDQTERFMPKPWDTKEEAQSRFRRFRQFISSYRSAVGADEQPTAQGETVSFADLPK